MAPNGHFVGDRRGVAPVIGVVLMVGIAVLLASLVGVLTFGIADEELNDPAPTVGVSFEYDTSAGTVTVVHEEGPVLDRDRLTVVQSDGSALTLASGSSFAAGDTLVDSQPYTASERIYVVWSRPGGDSSTVIAASTPP